jgi:hypothetical protein
MMSRETRKENSVWLIGFPSNELPPSWGEVLRRYFWLQCNNKLEIRNAVTEVVRAVMCIWEKVRIPTAEERNVIGKLERKVEQYRAIQKGKSRPSAPQIKKEDDIWEKLNELFDITHVDVLHIIKIEQDREFLMAQREPRRRGYMAGVDKVLTKIRGTGCSTS